MTRIAIWKFNPVGPEQNKLVAVQLSPSPQTLNSASQQIPGGVYTTFRTFENNLKGNNHGAPAASQALSQALHQAMPLEDHIIRLEESAALVNYPIRLERKVLRSALRQALADYPARDVRVRLTIDLEDQPGTIYITLEPLNLPSPEDYRNGVSVVTRRLHRENPHAKQTAFISVAETIRHELPANVNEGLLVDDDGSILEGLSSNFFAVKNGELWTAEEGVLSGITRSLVLQAASQEGIPVHLQSISIREIGLLQEAFLTSASRSILPIRQIDSTWVGSGEPGPITRRLERAYWQEIQRHLEKI